MSKNCSITCVNVCGGSAIALLFVISIPIVIIPFANFDNFEPATCFIERIDYPTTLPTLSNDENWAECDCGKYCNAWSPCIKLFTNISGEESVLKADYFDQLEGVCTFHNSTCINGEDIRYVNEYLETSQNIYDEYINKTVPCFYDSDLTGIYLEREFKLNLILVFSIPIGLIIICLLYGNIDHCCHKKKYCCYKTDEEEKSRSQITENAAFNAV